jgi:hypothetical protein
MINAVLSGVKSHPGIGWPSGSAQGAGGSAQGVNPFLATEADARARIIAGLSAMPEGRRAIEPVQPKFGTRDLLLGAIPTLALAFSGNGRDAIRYGTSFLGQKVQGAQEETARLQQQSDFDMAADLDRIRAQQAVAQAELGFAGQDVARWDQEQALRREATQKAVADQQTKRNRDFSLAQKFHDDAFNANTEPSYRVANAKQAIALLEQFPDDPAAATMAATLRQALPGLEKLSASNLGANLRNQRLQMVVANMPQEIRDKHEATMARIAFMRSGALIAQQNLNYKWLAQYAGMFDSAIADVDSEMKMYMGLETFTPEQLQRVKDLSEYRNRLLAEKAAIVMPEAPGTGGGGAPGEIQVNFPPAGNEGFGDGKSGVLTGSINGGRGLPLPKGGTALPIRDAAGAAKADQAAKAQKQKEDTEKADREYKQKMQHALEIQIQEFETQIAGLDPTDEKGIATLRRQQGAARQKLNELKGVKPFLTGVGNDLKKIKDGSARPPKDHGSGYGMPGMSQVNVALNAAKAAQSAAKGGGKPKAGTKASAPKDDIRAKAIRAIQQGKDPEAVRARYQKLTGKKADF